MTCEWCNSPIPDGAESCPACMMPVSKASAPVAEKPQEAATAPRTRKRRTRDTTGAKDRTEASETLKGGYSDVSKELSARDILNQGTVLTLEEVQKAIQMGQSGSHKVAMGVDPGARYTAISIRDDRGKVYLSSTFRRPDELDAYQWVAVCVDIVRYHKDNFAVDGLGVETVVKPRGFSGGKNASLDPGHIINTAIIVGAILNEFKDEGVVMVRPRNNGSQSSESYPQEIQGRRPASLPGYRSPEVATRNHERSAYDVAGTVISKKK